LPLEGPEKGETSERRGKGEDEARVRRGKGEGEAREGVMGIPAGFSLAFQLAFPSLFHSLSRSLFPGCSLASRCSSLSAPVAFDPIPAAALVSPVPVDPDGIPARWFNIVAGHPDIAGAVPTVIAVDPHPSFVRNGAGMFDDDVRRFDLNIDMLREGWGDAEQCSCSNQKQFLHEWGCPFIESEHRWRPEDLNRLRTVHGTRRGSPGCAQKIFSLTE